MTIVPSARVARWRTDACGHVVVTDHCTIGDSTRVTAPRRSLPASSCPIRGSAASPAGGR
jgi:hypothetical protein